MKERKLAIILFLLIFPTFYPVFGQEAARTSRQNSIEAFTKGDYEAAYRGFSELLASFPKDPLYKYYSAVSLVKMNKKPAEAQKLLEEAMAVPVKSLPDDAMFYMGRSRQMQGKFTEAEEAYKAYSAKAGRKAAKELNVDEYIQQCRQSTGKIAEAAVVKEEIVKKPDQKPVTSGTTLAVNSKKPELLPPDADRKMNDALNNQYKDDSLNAINEQKKQATKQVSLKTQENTISAKVTTSPDPSVKSSSPEGQKQVFENQKNKTTDTQDVAKKQEVAVLKPAGVYSVFEILPKPVTDPKVKVEVNPSVPDGLIYRIQLAVFKNPVAYSYFKGITPIYGFKLSGSAVTTYYGGMFRKLNDANKALTEVKAKGFRDSFVAGLVGNKPVSADRAAVLEQEWASKPLFNVTRTDTGVEADTIPPTLVFRVEVMKSLKPLKEEEVENLRKLAGNRGIDIVSLNDGSTTYLIGNFITFESADQYADLLKRNGYRESRVAAWLGKKEIDVDTARKLFENLK